MKTLFAALLAFGLVASGANAASFAPVQPDNSVAEWCNDYKGH